MNHWRGSDRAARLPPDWGTRRAAALTRASHQCQATIHAPNCDRTATEVDHITPGDDHTPTNLQALSEPCHRAKTARESAARNRERAKLRVRPEAHPGAV